MSRCHLILIICALLLGSCRSTAPAMPTAGTTAAAPESVGGAPGGQAAALPEGERAVLDAGASAGEIPALVEDDGRTPSICSGFSSGASEPGVLTDLVGDEGVLIAPDDPRLFYMGRVDCAASRGPRFAYPGVMLRVRFEGTALDAVLADSGTGSAQTTNYYDVRVDDGTPTLLEVRGGQGRYTLASGLGEGEHTLELFKRVESGPAANEGAGTGQLLALRLPPGGVLLQASGKLRRLEFIGDSITCGYGNEVSTQTPESAPYTSLGSNAQQAYGAVAARMLDAEYMAVAYSGRGVSRNYGGNPGGTLPQIYDRVLPDEPASPVWDVGRYRPHAVVVNLGTNDFSPGGVDRAAFRQSYVDFLARLRVDHPEAVLMVVAGPMISDFFPAGEMAWTRIQEDLSEVIRARETAGDTRLLLQAFSPQTGPWGQDYHPTLATHAMMAEQVVARLRTALGW